MGRPRPFLAALGCGLAESPRAGRPMADPRARLDAIFRAVTLKRPAREGGGRAYWKQLPETFGKPDTISRTHRRWGAAGLWRVLLVAVASRHRSAALEGLTHWVCCAFRRGIRQAGLAGLVLARRLRLFSALPGPSRALPDPDLSEAIMPVVRNTVESMLVSLHGPRPWWPPRAWLRWLGGMLHFCAGHARLPRALEPA